MVLCSQALQRERPTIWALEPKQAEWGQGREQGDAGAERQGHRQGGGDTEGLRDIDGNSSEETERERERLGPEGKVEPWGERGRHQDGKTDAETRGTEI